MLSFVQSAQSSQDDQKLLMLQLSEAREQLLESKAAVQQVLIISTWSCAVDSERAL